MSQRRNVRNGNTPLRRAGAPNRLTARASLLAETIEPHHLAAARRLVGRLWPFRRFFDPVVRCGRLRIGGRRHCRHRRGGVSCLDLRCINPLPAAPPPFSPPLSGERRGGGPLPLRPPGRHAPPPAMPAPPA